MTIEVTAYSWVPAFAQGYVRDLRVRWALEEAGLPYKADLFDVRHKPAGYRVWQPFNQVPAYRRWRRGSRRSRPGSATRTTWKAGSAPET